MAQEPADIARFLAAMGEPTELPRRSPPRGPPYWKSRVLRRQALGDEDDGQGCWLRGRVLPDEHPMVAALLQVLGLSLLDQARGAEAEPVLRESLDLRRRSLPEGHWLVGSSEGVLGDCLSRRGRYREAEPFLLRAHEALAAQFGSDHERVVEARKRLVALYEAWGRPAEADRFREPPRAKLNVRRD